MKNLLLPFPVTKVENGLILYYFTTEDFNLKEVFYNFVFIDENKDCCIFNNKFIVPIEIVEKLSDKEAKFLFFMKYSLESINAELLFSYEIDENFIIDYKAFLKYKENYIYKEKIAQKVEEN